MNTLKLADNGVGVSVFPRANQPRDRLPPHSSSTMPGRKAKTRTLTKIDPDTLSSGARAFSQHGTSNTAARVTTTINPTPRPATLPEAIPFNVDPSNVVSESSGDEGNGEGGAREYYIARVRAFSFPGRVDSPQH